MNTTPSPSALEATASPDTLRLALPKGRTQASVITLLRDAGIELDTSSRAYRPNVSLEGVDTKLLKPQNIVRMLHSGTRDIGFAGADWVAEFGADLVELVDTGLDPVRVVAAAPTAALADGRLRLPKPRIATEFVRLTEEWIERSGNRGRVVRTFGATEVFPPEDADCIVDLVSSGATLRANGLYEFDELLRSSTRLYANREALQDDNKRARIDAIVLLVNSVLDARRRVMLELNVGDDGLESVLERLPCMREPTLAKLASGGGYAVRAAVPSRDLANLLPELRAIPSASDLVVTPIAQIVS